MVILICDRIHLKYLYSLFQIQANLCRLLKLCHLPGNPVTVYRLKQGKSSTVMVEYFSDCVNETFENNKLALSLFLDPTNAFDTI